MTDDAVLVIVNDVVDAVQERVVPQPPVNVYPVCDKPDALGNEHDVL